MRAAVGVRVWLVAALAVLAVLGVAVTSSFRLTTRPSSGTVPPDLQVTLPPRPTSFPVEGGEPMPDLALGERLGAAPLVVLGLLALLVAVVLVVVLRRVVRTLRDAAPALQVPDELDVLPAAPELPPLRRGIVTAQAALDDPARPPRDAVVAAWLALEQAAGRTGVVRHRAQTPTQYAQAVLGATLADPDATQGLLGLYLVARFSEHPVGRADVESARAHLVALARTLDLVGTPSEPAGARLPDDAVILPGSDGGDR